MLFSHNLLFCMDNIQQEQRKSKEFITSVFFAQNQKTPSQSSLHLIETVDDTSVQEKPPIILNIPPVVDTNVLSKDKTCALVSAWLLCGGAVMAVCCLLGGVLIYVGVELILWIITVAKTLSGVH